MKRWLTVAVAAATVTAIAGPMQAAVASPTGTITLGDGATTSHSPNPIGIIGASATSTVYLGGVYGDQQIIAVPTAGGSAQSISGVSANDYPLNAVGTLVTGVNPATGMLEFENTNGTGAGSVAIDTSTYSPVTGSSDGEYVLFDNGDNTTHLLDFKTNGLTTDLGALPNADVSTAHAFAAGGADSTGVVLVYQDPTIAPTCSSTQDADIVVDVIGTTMHTLHAPSGCEAWTLGGPAIGGGNAAWISWPADYTSATQPQVNWVATSGGTPSTAMLPNNEMSIAITSTQVGVAVYGAVTGSLQTMPTSGGSPSTSSFPLAEDTFPVGLASAGAQFAIAEDDSLTDAGVYTVADATGTPAEIATGTAQPLRASAIALGPGQVAYNTNDNANKPIWHQTLTNSGSSLTQSAVDVIQNHSTGYGISLSGNKLSYLDATAGTTGTVNVLQLLTEGAVSSTTVASSADATPLDPNVVPQLSGERILYAVLTTNGRGYQVFDRVTGSTTAVGDSHVVAAALFGDYVVRLTDTGDVNRLDLATSVTQTIYHVPTYASGDSISGGVSAFGNTVAWSVLDTNSTPTTNEDDHFVTVAPGATPPAPTLIPNGVVNGKLALSSGYLAYLEGTTQSLVALPLGGGSATAVSSQTPLYSSQSFALDGSTIAWEEGPTFDSGTPKAAPLPVTPNQPRFLGDPDAPTTYTLGSGTWDADMVASAALTSTSCSVTINTTPAKPLNCDATRAALGDVGVSWDGTDGNGAAVAPGDYTWTLTGSNGDGSLLAADGSTTAITGTIHVYAPGASNPPSSLSATGGNGQVALSWTAPAPNGTAPVTSYNVYRATTSGAESLLASGVTSTSYKDTAVNNGTTYYYTVKAVNASGGSTASNEASALAGGAPGAPTGLGTTVGNGQLGLSWSAPGSNGGLAISGYDVYRSTTAGVQGGRIASGVAGTSFTDTGLANGTTYYYVITAVNAAGEGAPSAQAAGQPTGAGPAVTITSGPAASTTSHSASFGFTATNPANSTVGFTCSLDGGTPVACSSPANYPSVGDGQHTFTVKATDGYGSSSTASASWLIDSTAPSITPVAPKAPFQLAAKIYATFAGSDAGSGVATYDIRYRSATWNGKFGSYAYPSTWQHHVGGSVSLSGARGRDYCFSARVRDNLGDTSGWTADRCTSRALDERALIRSAGWATGTGTKYYAHTWTRTSTSGAKLTIKGAQVRRIALVVYKCKTCGKVAIYVGGHYFKTVNTYSATAKYQMVVIEPTFSLRTTTIVLRVTTAGKPVTIDGIGISRT